MNRQAIWDFWSTRYERLWVQRVVLAPTRAALLGHLAPLEPGRLLDMGCGTAQLLEALDQAGMRPAWDYTGVDASAAMIEQSRLKHPNARLECASVETFESPPGHFEAVVCSHAFPYMPDAPAALARLAGWVRPGGRLLLAQACAETLYDRLMLSFVKLTVSRARYRPVTELRTLAKPLLGEPIDIVRLDHHVAVPTLRLVVWQKARDEADGAADREAPA